MSSVEPVELVTEGGRIEGWKRVSIVRSIERPSFAAGFALTLSELHPTDPVRRQLRRGDPCAVKLGGEEIIAGYLQQVSPSYGPTDHSIEVSGWDVTADLVACSIIGKVHTPATLEQIAAELCEPFGIEVSVDVDTGKAFDAVKIEPGEPRAQVLQRLASYRGVIFVPDGRGGLRITLPGLERAGVELLRGKQIQEASRVDDDGERFSEITIESQRAAGWGGEASGAAISARATDPGVDRYRPLVIIADEPPTDREALAARAQREVNLRLARGQKISILVTGWRVLVDAGKVWTPGDLVPLRDDWLGVNEELVIATVRLSQDGGGQKAQLDLVPPMAFDLRPVPEPKPAAPEFW